MEGWDRGTEEGVAGEEGEEGGGVRSGPGAARTILLFHIISARSSKQPKEDDVVYWYLIQ